MRGQPWTADEDALLRLLYGQSMPIADMVERFTGRNASGITQRAWALKLRNGWRGRRPKPKPPENAIAVLWMGAPDRSKPLRWSL